MSPRLGVLASLLCILFLLAFVGARADVPAEPPTGELPPPAPLRQADVRPASGFDVEIAGRKTAMPVFSLTVMPGESVPVQTAARGATLTHAAGSITRKEEGKWVWTAPTQPGVASLRLEAQDRLAAVHINVFVMHPAAHMEGGNLHGYAIGTYMPRGSRSDSYDPPSGFVEVRPEDEDILISPNFTIGQFLCKQPGQPRYVAVSSPLVMKLERILEAVRRHGHDVPTLTVMSGFRTPTYNRAIGNTTSFSRHLWGDAADIYVDADGNGDMDDLNGDGVSDLSDAHVLSSIVERVEADHSDLVPGGLSNYRRNSAHGPFVHVDARGYSARW